MSETDADYPCVGVCMVDPDSGYCLGCGRPPPPLSFLSPEPVEEKVHEERPPAGLQDSPCILTPA